MMILGDDPNVVLNAIDVDLDDNHVANSLVPTFDVDGRAGLARRCRFRSHH